MKSFCDSYSVVDVAFHSCIHSCWKVASCILGEVGKVQGSEPDWTKQTATGCGKERQSLVLGKWQNDNWLSSPLLPHWAWYWAGLASSPYLSLHSSQSVCWILLGLVNCSGVHDVQQLNLFTKSSLSSWSLPNRNWQWLRLPWWFKGIQSLDIWIESASPSLPPTIVLQHCPKQKESHHTRFKVELGAYDAVQGMSASQWL